MFCWCFTHFLYTLNIDSIEGNEGTTDAEERGNENWIGRQVSKEFAGHGTFKGIVAAFDDDEENPGQRIFHVIYSDGDDAWMSAKDVKEILVPEHELVCK